MKDMKNESELMETQEEKQTDYCEEERRRLLALQAVFLKVKRLIEEYEKNYYPELNK